LLARAQTEAERFGLGLEVMPLGRSEPSPMDERAQRAFAGAAGSLGLKSLSMPSGAGHDAQLLAGICPTGMAFVPSVGGASHAPREFTSWEDCLNGANLLLQAALRVAGGG